MANVILEKDPALLAKKVEAMPAGRTKRALQVARTSWMVEQDPKAAIQFAKEQPVAIRSSALSRIGQELPSQASDLKMEVLEALVRENGSKEQSGGRHPVPNWIMEELLRDPPAVMKLHEEAAPTTLPSLVRGWARKDPERSVAWLSNHQNHENYDMMTTEIWMDQGMGSWNGSVTDQQMLGLLSNLNNQEKAISYSRQTLRGWRRRDPEGLRTYFQSGSATPEQIQWWREQSQ
jgi:hypothetical protein